MEFIQGFNWAVPQAFNDAITQCRFEAGDTLYDTKKAYRQWSNALKYLQYGIEVKSAQSLPTNIKSTFDNNWNSPVELELTHYKNKNKKELIKTTHGRLFTCIWHGDASILQQDTSEPDIPLLLKQLTKKLDYIQSEFHKLVGAGNTFAMAYDPANSINREKKSKLSDSLKAVGPLTVKNYSLSDLHLSDTDRFHPTLSVLCFTSDGKGEEVKEALQTALYTGTGSPKAKSFRIQTHGIYFEVLTDKQETGQKLF